LIFAFLASHPKGRLYLDLVRIQLAPDFMLLQAVVVLALLLAEEAIHCHEYTLLYFLKRLTGWGFKSLWAYSH
jgi:hypothetical protein